MKERLDVLLVKKGLAASREKAKTIIMSGNVYVNGQKEDKAGSVFEETAEVTVKENPLRYVSRGGLKLEKAMACFDVSVEGKICMDIGASTGGFTDCMLQNRAARVYAVDVGYGQLDWKLRNDPRVVVMEKTNIRYLTREEMPEPVAFATADVSFISLTKILEPVSLLLTPDAQMVCLVKPQFEAGRGQVGKKGVVRDPAVHEDVLDRILAYAAGIGFDVLGLDYSPVRGPEGNIEYLIHLARRPEGAGTVDPELSVGKTVQEAHAAL